MRQDETKLRMRRSYAAEGARAAAWQAMSQMRRQSRVGDKCRSGEDRPLGTPPAHGCGREEEGGRGPVRPGGSLQAGQAAPHCAALSDLLEVLHLVEPRDPAAPACSDCWQRPASHIGGNIEGEWS